MLLSRISYDFNTGFLTGRTGPTKHRPDPARKPETLAVNLFSALRKFDELGVDIVFAEWVEEKDEGLAVMNRMLRAAGFRVIEV